MSASSREARRYVVSFSESLRGRVVAVPAELGLGQDAAATVDLYRSLAQTGPLCDLALDDLLIAVDTGYADRSGGLPGAILAGTVRLAGEPATTLDVVRGDFALLGGDTDTDRRMRYDVTLCEPEADTRWRLRGTKLVTGSTPLPLPQRMWWETTTLAVTLTDPSGREYAGVVAVGLAEFGRQARSVRGSPAGIARLVRFFVGRLLQVYLGDGVPGPAIPVDPGRVDAP